METKPELTIAPKKSRAIKKELLINGGDLDLYLDVFLTDKEGKTEKVITKKADSILANFMRMMYIMMTRDKRNNVLGGTFYRLGHTFTGANITSITSGSGGKFRLYSSSTIFSTYPSTGYITLGGFKGINLNGRYTFTKIDGYYLDIDGTSYTTGWVTGTGGGSAYFPITNIGNAQNNTLQDNGIIIGTGDAPVTIDDQLLHKQIPSSSANGGLTYNSSTVSLDTNDSTSAQITLTRTFTNNATDTVGVKEIGYLQESGGGILMTMRDVLPATVNVGTGTTLTVNYRLKTVLGTGTDPGGFITNFMRLLYRHIANQYRVAILINNTGANLPRTYTTFCAVYAGGNSILFPHRNENNLGYLFGVVLGRGDTAVSMGDYYLETPIVHGKGSNEMLYYGGFGEDFTVGVDYAEFSIYKALENDSGSPITIKEYALVVGAGEASSSATVTNLTAITRNVLTTPVTVADQEILKVGYTLRCVVGGSS